MEARDALQQAPRYVFFFFSFSTLLILIQVLSTHTNVDDSRGRKRVGARARDAATVGGNSTIFLQQIL